eukprot:3876131-Prymnesium_polylepis.1
MRSLSGTEGIRGNCATCRVPPGRSSCVKPPSEPRHSWTSYGSKFSSWRGAHTETEHWKSVCTSRALPWGVQSLPCAQKVMWNAETSSALKEIICCMIWPYVVSSASSPSAGSLSAAGRAASKVPSTSTPSNASSASTSESCSVSTHSKVRVCSRSSVCFAAPAPRRLLTGAMRSTSGWATTQPSASFAWLAKPTWRCVISSVPRSCLMVHGISCRQRSSSGTPDFLSRSSDLVRHSSSSCGSLPASCCCSARNVRLRLAKPQNCAPPSGPTSVIADDARTPPMAFDGWRLVSSSSRSSRRPSCPPADPTKQKKLDSR